MGSRKMAARSIGVPIKLLHEAEGHTVTCESKTGEGNRGQLLEAEDNMNCYIGSVTMTAKDGRTSKLEQVAIRGSQIRFLILPDMLKNAPMFKKQLGGGSAAAGRGRGASAGGRGRGERWTVKHHCGEVWRVSQNCTLQA